MKNKKQNKKFCNPSLFPKSRQGLSAVIAALLLILLALVLVGVLWTVISNLVNDKLDETASCSDAFGKVGLNDAYTCYNTSVGYGYQHFSIKLGDIDVEEVVVSISGNGMVKSFNIKTDLDTITSVGPYMGLPNTAVKLPGKNGGLTYLYDTTTEGFTGVPNSITIAPVINGNQCDVSASIYDIPNCPLN